MTEIAQKAKKASKQARSLTTKAKNELLASISYEIDKNKAKIITANSIDIENLPIRTKDSFRDRLLLDEPRIENMLTSISDIIDLPDPIGQIIDLGKRPNGLHIKKMRIALGVIGIIYESRPNVTTDASALCLKSGNSVILRGGSESINTNLAIGKIIRKSLINNSVDPNLVQVIEDTSRDLVSEIASADEYIDLIIPRGSKELLKFLQKHATIPMIKHLDGVCHVFIDDSADIKKSLDISVNSKTNRFGVCNAMETLLVSEIIAVNFLPKFAKILMEKKVEIRGCDASRKIVPNLKIASEADWQEEYLAPILAVKVVAGLDDAINHINKFGSHHTDAIVSENEEHQKRFLREIESSSVLVNTSTRFADGFEYGLGAEIGISTDKIHARGPVGLEGLTSLKWVVSGNGQVRD
ncbi:MAG: glutamate-5-semialdehyde dehydrogenase [Porticoccaceae bacterium]|nr:glutamate-5-semialdehyde dehydrogenase [Porticoccaceae bacterium]